MLTLMVAHLGSPYRPAWAVSVGSGLLSASRGATQLALRGCSAARRQAAPKSLALHFQPTGGCLDKAGGGGEGERHAPGLAISPSPGCYCGTRGGDCGGWEGGGGGCGTGVCAAAVQGAAGGGSQGDDSMVKCPHWQCPCLAPVPPLSALAGSRQLDTLPGGEAWLLP